MSTRATYTFVETGGADKAYYHVYKHHDGYPEGAEKALKAALDYAWPLPRYEADELAAAFVAANKDGPGGIRLTADGAPEGWKDKALDQEYHYEISPFGDDLYVRVFDTELGFPGTGKEDYVRLIWDGPLRNMARVNWSHAG
jgi:hypothetical protein